LLGDDEIVIDRLRQLLHLCVERLRLVRIGRRQTLFQRQLLGPEIGQREAGIADRHQRLVVGGDDQPAGFDDAVHRGEAEKAGDGGDRAKRQEDLAANRHRDSVQSALRWQRLVAKLERRSVQRPSTSGNVLPTRCAIYTNTSLILCRPS
jgi:hypothetical protein